MNNARTQLDQVSLAVSDLSQQATILSLALDAIVNSGAVDELPGLARQLLLDGKERVDHVAAELPRAVDSLLTLMTSYAATELGSI